MENITLRDIVSGNFISDSFEYEKTKEIIAEYYDLSQSVDYITKKLNISKGNLRSVLPKFTTHHSCYFCRVKMIAPIPARSNLKKRNGALDLDQIASYDNEKCICPNCKHNLGYFCQCDGCVMSRKNKYQAEKQRMKSIEDEKRALIDRDCGYKPETGEDLLAYELNELFGLSAYLRNYLQEDMRHIFSLEDITPENKTFHDDKDLINLLRMLDDNGLIYVCRYSNLDAFTFERKDDGTLHMISYKLSKVKYLLNYDVNNDEKETTSVGYMDITDILYPSWTKYCHHLLSSEGFSVKQYYDNVKISELEDEEKKEYLFNYIANHSFKETLKFWKDLTLKDAIEQLNYRLSEYDFPYKIGDKTKLLIKELLEEFSLGQLNYFFYSVTKDMAAYARKENVYLKQAFNSLNSKLKNISSRAKANHWDTSYTRNWNCPITMISKVFMTEFLGLPEDKLDVVPSYEYLVTLTKKFIEQEDLERSNWYD